MRFCNLKKSLRNQQPAPKPPTMLTEEKLRALSSKWGVTLFNEATSLPVWTGPFEFVRIK